MKSESIIFGHLGAFTVGIIWMTITSHGTDMTSLFLHLAWCQSTVTKLQNLLNTVTVSQCHSVTVSKILLQLDSKGFVQKSVEQAGNVDLWIFVLIIYISLSRQQRNIAEQWGRETLTWLNIISWIEACTLLTCLTWLISSIEAATRATAAARNPIIPIQLVNNATKHAQREIV